MTTMHMKNLLLFIGTLVFVSCNNSDSTKTRIAAAKDSTASGQKKNTEERAPLDTARYNHILKYLSNGDSSGRWPVKGTPYPVPGAILPFHRIVAYYGNLYSKRMGVLGEYPKDEMIRKLLAEVKKWSASDSMLPAIPALHYIAVTAQGSPGKDNKYRARMPFKQIDTILSWAKEINAQVFLDIQVGFSSLQDEVPLLEKYLSLPNVHLGVDPEFAMSKKGKKPGTVIGTMDASEINWVGNYLANLVKKNNLPPKIFMIHRFTQGMVTNAKQIKTHPELQVVIDMDGWGTQERKRSTYYDWINPEPVQFTGFKLFYKNDTQKVGAKQEMQPSDVRRLRPIPVYIQYQ
jgi:hypothetical protein